MIPSTAVRSAGPTAIEAPIDLVQLAASTLGNHDLELEVLHLFKIQSEATLSRLNAERDGQQRMELVHTLKGSARSVGAARVAEACEQMEIGMSAGGSASSDALESAVGEAQRYIQELLDG